MFKEAKFWIILVIKTASSLLAASSNVMIFAFFNTFLIDNAEIESQASFTCYAASKKCIDLS